MFPVAVKVVETVVPFFYHFCIIFLYCWTCSENIWNICCWKLNSQHWIKVKSLGSLSLPQLDSAVNDYYNCKIPVFNSPGHRPCELLSWLSVRRPSFSFSHLNLLLWNHWTELNQTCQKCSLDGPLPELCFWCWFEIQHGCQGP